MGQLSHYYENGKMAVKGEVLNDPRIHAYLRERGFKRSGREKTWVAEITPEQVADFLTWAGTRGWTADRMPQRPKQLAKHRTSFVGDPPKPKVVKGKPAKTNNVTYGYGKVGGNPNAQLRGGGLQHPDAKHYILSKGFRWVFKRGMRNVKAYEAAMTPHELIEILLHLKLLGLLVTPSASLPPKRWLYLDLPKVFETLPVKAGDTDIGEWLEHNGYTRMPAVEQPGDYAVKGDTFYVWTKEDDALIRIVFDGETVESIAKVDPETLDAEFLPTITINGLVEKGEVKPQVRATPAELVQVPTPEPKEKEPTLDEAMQMYADIAAAHMTHLFAQSLIAVPAPVAPTVRPTQLKYTPTRVQQMEKKFQKLDESHPFFNMVKWEQPKE